MIKASTDYAVKEFKKLPAHEQFFMLYGNASDDRHLIAFILEKQREYLIEHKNNMPK